MIMRICKAPKLLGPWAELDVTLPHISTRRGPLNQSFAGHDA